MDGLVVLWTRSQQCAGDCYCASASSCTRRPLYWLEKTISWTNTGQDNGSHEGRKDYRVPELLCLTRFYLKKEEEEEEDFLNRSIVILEDNCKGKRMDCSPQGTAVSMMPSEAFSPNFLEYCFLVQSSSFSPSSAVYCHGIYKLGKGDTRSWLWPGRK